MSSYSYISLGSASAVAYNTPQELLEQLPDNSASLIQASDIRDAVYSLWLYTESVEAIAYSASNAAGSQYYSNSNTVPYAVGGITAGATFPGTFSIQQMFDRLLYPYVAPSATLGSLATREFGQSLSVSLSWAATVNTNPLLSVIVDGSVQSFPPYTGNVLTNGTYSLPLTLLQQTNTFNMSVTDTYPTTFNTSTTLTWRHRMYWGKFNFGSVNLTTNPGSASYMASLISDLDVRSMLSGNANGSATNNALAVDKGRTLNAMNGGGNHLVFAWPTIFPSSTTPTFTVNGLASSAFTPLKTGYIFTNQYGLTASYEIWVSNTIQNSALNIVIS